MELKKDITYLNTASCGLLSKESLAKANDLYENMVVNATGATEQWRMHSAQPIRETLARFIDAPVGNVAFIPNFTFGLLSIVHSLTGSEKVLLYENDFPSLIEPFRINGFNISWVGSEDGFSISLDKIKRSLIDNSLNVFAVSHVQFNTGFKIDIYDLAVFCRQNNILFIVDATQSLGALAISMNELGADVVIASNYKWMNGGVGTGVIYVADSFLEKHTPKMGGYNSYTMTAERMFYEPSARSFEPGHMNMPGILVLEAAMKEKLAIGLNSIEEHNRKLAIQLLEALKALPVQLIGNDSVENRSSIIVIKDQNGLGQFLQEKNIVVTIRGGVLRISIHFYNTIEDINCLIKALRLFYKLVNT